MDFKESAMVEVRSKEALFNVCPLSFVRLCTAKLNRILSQNFFFNLKALIQKAAKDGRRLDGQHYHEAAEAELLGNLQKAQVGVHKALCDSFDTPSAIENLVDLVTSANTYISSKQGSLLNTTPIEAVASWVTRILRIFGLGEGPGFSYDGRPEIGWGEVVTGDGAAANVSFPCFVSHQTLILDHAQREAVALPFVETLSSFRDQVRRIGRGNPELMALCDKLRDEDMVQLGVALDDQAGPYHRSRCFFVSLTHLSRGLFRRHGFSQDDAQRAAHQSER